MNLFIIIVTGLIKFQIIYSHMLMSFPLSRGYVNNPSYPNIDYDLKSPLPSLIMCKGKPPGSAVQTWNAGQTVNVKFEGSAKHGGGICQFALSYDNDHTFVVIQEILGPCPQEGFDWPVKLPANLPNCERCTFSWSWINAIGNREFYMNCADVKIIGTGQGKISGRPMLIGNMAGYPIIQPRIHPGGGPNSPGTIINNFQALPENKILITPSLTKPSPDYEIPLKDSYTNSSSLLKESSKLNWGSPSGMIQTPLKLASPSPKLSERVTSPLATTSISSPMLALSPSRGVGIGSTWSATLDEQLNKIGNETTPPQKSSLKISGGNENVTDSQGSNSDSSKKTGPSKPSKFVFERELLGPELSLQYCNLSSNLENYIENVHGWFIRKLLRPLSEEIVRIDSALESAGLSHLSSKCPANYSMAAKSMDAELMSSHLCFSAPTGFNNAKIQTLTDLERSRPNDPIVKARMKIEKYLSMALITTQRISLIKKISSLSEGSFISSFHPKSSESSSFDDTQVLLHLFCMFMNDNLPSENANDPVPFTSTYFVSSEEKVSNRRDAIQLHQTSSNPVNLEIIAEDKILQVHPGHNNLFEAILLLIDFAHRNRRGYLGIGNLDSINIDLVSILRN